MNQKQITDGGHRPPLQKAAQSELLRTIAGKWDEQERDVAAVGPGLLRMMNRAREIGLLFIEVRGQEQMEFAHWNGFYRGIKSQLPASLERERAEGCIRIARLMPEAVQSLQEARTLLQMNLELAGLLEESHRQAPQNRDPKPPLIRLTEVVARTVGQIREWETAEPVEKWDDERRETVREELKPIVDFYQKL